MGTIEHIRAALQGAGEILLRHSHLAEERGHQIQRKADGQPVTQADLDADAYLRDFLPREDEGWLSEETDDDRIRLEQRRIWIVDPLDGTKEFIHGIGEWSVSIGLVEDGVAIAGGILNPVTDELVVGSLEDGVYLGAQPCKTNDKSTLDGAVVVASRNELRRGEWRRFDTSSLDIRAVGSVAYKMSLVACGRADCMWTYRPKNEWDVAAGVALIHAAGGSVWRPDDEPIVFNQSNTILPGIIASSGAIRDPLRQLLRAS